MDSTYLSDFPRYIVVEGPIGVGKTTLVERLASRFGVRPLLEVFEENPFLADFYEHQEQFAFQTEMFFLLSRYRQQEEFSQPDLFSRLHISDYLFVKCRLFASLTLSDHELALYDRMYNILITQIPEPDLVIHLTAPVQVLLERIEERGRPYEEKIEAGYLERLSALYHNFFAHYEDSALLEVDASEVNFAEDDDALDELVERVRARWRAEREPRERLIEF